MAGAMVLAMAACGATEEPTEPEVTDVVVSTGLEGVSLDFEDGNFGFAVEASFLKGGDPVVLEVKDVNGSKALTTVNQTGETKTVIGFDIDALLGDKVADVAKIQYTIGSLDSEFHAFSGKLYTYTGEDLAENTTEYAVYLATANPKVVTVDVKAPFVAGASNYILISKESNTASDPTEIFIDDIGFFDADGNVIAADSAATVGAGSKLIAEVEEGVEVIHGNGEYPGNWCSTADKGLLIPDALFAGAEKNIKVILEYKVNDDNDGNLCIKPMSTWWTVVGPEGYVGMTMEADATDATKYYRVEDGNIKVVDPELTSIEFVVTPDVAAIMAEQGGMAFQVNGVTIDTIKVTDESYVTITGDKYKFSGELAGDWTLTPDVIPASAFEGVTGDVTVYLKVEAVADGKHDYYCIAPMTPDWQKVSTEYYVDPTEIYEEGAELPEGTKYHLKTDGVFAIDDFSTTVMKFTINAEGAAKIVEKGGMPFMVYGVAVKAAYVDVQ